MANVDFKPKLLTVELGMFLTIQFIALIVGTSFVKKGLVQQMPTAQALPSFFIEFLIAMGILIAAIYLLKTPKSFAFFFAFMMFIGTEIVFEAFLPSIIAIIIAIAIVVIRYVKPNVFTHNLAIFLTVAGISAQLGTMLPVLAIIVILIALSIYDYIAVFKTKTMVGMFKKMLERGAPFAIVVPESVEHFGEKIEKVSKEKLKQHEKKKPAKPKFMMLGTGDLAFPAVFAVSALAEYNWIASVAIVAGAMAGIVVNHYFLTQKFRAIPALPAIATFSIIGFVMSQLPGWI